MNIHPQNYGWQQVYKVLIIEDSEADFELYRRFLKKDEVYNYKIKYAETAAEGLEFFSTYHPDFIIIDFSLPDMDGLELVEAIQRVNKSVKVPIIMITGHGNQAIAVQAMKKNIHDYFIKDDLDFQKFITGIYGLITTINSYQISDDSKNIDILLVDDVEADLELYKAFLQRDQDYLFDVYTANTAAEALFFLKHKKVDILLTDYQLPDMNGIDLVCSYHKFSASEETCMILMTGYGSEQLVVQAMKNGISDYFVKQDMTRGKLQKLIKDNFHKHRLSNKIKEIQVQKNLITKISANIRSSLDLEKIIQTSTLEVKKYLNCDRVVIYQLDELGNGKVVGESVKQPFTKLLGFSFQDTFFQDPINRNEYINNCRKQVISDIHTANINLCHQQLLEQFQVKAIVSVPIVIQNLSHPLWGLLIVHHCQESHKWKQEEVNFITEISLQIAIGVQQGLLVKELIRERDRANAATHAKSMFLANMSHEIRTPMNGILGMTEMLSLSSLSAEQADYVKTIQDSGKNLLNLINDILDLSKLESGNIELKETQFFLQQDIINYIFKLLGVAIKEKGLELHLDIENNLHDAYVGDADRLRQILINLIGNAVKFTAQGKITITIHQLKSASNLSENETEIYFAIQDTGVGIAPADQSSLFKPFSQVENSTTRNFTGTGLGLSICKRLVELMGGKIGVTSVLDQGSTFWFTVKLQFLDSVSLQSAHIQKQINQIKEMMNKTARILVAEDNIVNQKVIKNQLKKIGYDCDIVGNGQAVLDILKEKSYNLILMDCQMPVLDGYDATRKIRYDENRQDLIIIGLSAFAMKDDKQKCLDAGMNDYLSKPSTIDDLQNMIKRWVEI